MPDLDQIRPSLSRRVAQQVSDLAGGVAYGGGVEGSTSVSFSGPTADFFHYNVVNGSFAQGPPNSNDYIDAQNNPLPYWYGPIQTSGGAIQALWVADAGSPSGFNLRFIVNPGAGGDTAQFSQIVALGGSRARWTEVIGYLSILPVACSSALPNAFVVTLNLEFLDAGLNSLVSIDTTAPIFGSGDVGTLLLATRGGEPTQLSGFATAAYLRVNLSAKRGAAAGTDSATVDVTDIRVLRGVPGLLLADDTAPATNFSSLIHQTNGAVTIPKPWLVFPATQNASANVNTLDDYDEGTFTPALAYATVGSSTWATNFALGWYTKIGNTVHYSLFYSGVPTNGTASGNLTLTGLPFAAMGTTNEHHEGATSMSGWTKASYTMVTMQVQQGGTVAQFQASGSGQAISPLAVADIPSGGTVIVRASGIYMTA
jgi:hypothetical protein